MQELYELWERMAPLVSVEINHRCPICQSHSRWFVKATQVATVANTACPSCADSSISVEPDATLETGNEMAKRGEGEKK